MKSSDTIAIATREIGITEDPPNSNRVKYNTWMYNGRLVSGSAYPWCCAFISWLFMMDQSLCKKTASCLELLTWFERNGQIVKVPKPGDIVFFKYSTNARRTNHVGLVVEVNGSNITTIEGNSSSSEKGSQDNGGAVVKKVRNKNIVAYARPCYDDAFVELKKGDKGAFVKKLQKYLNKRSYKLVEDGDYGILTFNALVAFQAEKGLSKTGICDEKTWSYLIK